MGWPCATHGKCTNNNNNKINSMQLVVNRGEGGWMRRKRIGKESVGYKEL